VVGVHSVRHTLSTALHQAREAPADVAAPLGHEVNTHLRFCGQRTEASTGRGCVRCWPRSSEYCLEAHWQRSGGPFATAAGDISVRRSDPRANGLGGLSLRRSNLRLWLPRLDSNQQPCD